MSKTTKEIKRIKLLEQGVSMLTNQGYHGTGLQEMLDEVKVPKGSFYAYFGSKEAFCVEVIQHYIEPVIQQLKGNLQDPTLNGLSAINKHLDTLIEMYKAKQFIGGCLLGNLIGELGNSNDAIRIALQDAMQRYQCLFTQAFAEAQQDGLVCDDFSAEQMASLLVNSWQGALLRMQIEQSAEPLELCRDSLLRNYYIN
jgi:TetR/AcrR family transcriptional repressor of nem operon